MNIASYIIRKACDMKTVRYLLTCMVFGLTSFVVAGTDRCREMIVSYFFLTIFTCYRNVNEIVP